jgi:hypothetical protein
VGSCCDVLFGKFGHANGGTTYAGKLKGAILIRYYSMNHQHGILVHRPGTHAKWHSACVSVHVFADYGEVIQKRRQRQHGHMPSM